PSSQRRGARLSLLAPPLIAIALSAALVSIVLAALGASPIGVASALAEGAFGNWFAFTDTLVKATPLIFTGLAISIAFSGALWNIGADGQLVIGAIAAGAIGPWLDGWPRAIAISIVLIGGAFGGALWGGMCGWLRARRGTNEVISTIMLNFVAMQILSWTVHGPLMERSRAYPQSIPIAPSTEMYMMAPTRLNLGMLLAVALAIACYLFLFRSKIGYEMRAVGKNRRAASFFAFPIARLTVLGMALSGALAGLGGAVQISAINHRLYEKISPGWGYEAIAVALVARLNPIAIIFTAVLFGALDNGSQAMQRAEGVSPVLVQVIQAMVIIVLLCFDTRAFSTIRGAFASATIAPAIPAGEVPDA
ncbi:MAG TPA: ABC transporter permease, partial [Candidatus Binataceae bacterium]|nr:ABC transporter permease [Candidatus Binataceae bacterium]